MSTLEMPRVPTSADIGRRARRLRDDGEGDVH
jgi:hypothetical protein